MLGVKGGEGGLLDLRGKEPPKQVKALETGRLEERRGRWNSMCRGKMRRDMEEHPWRRRPPGLLLTLRHESVGSK